MCCGILLLRCAIINRCHDPTESVKTREIKEVINYAAGKLCAKGREVNNWLQLFYSVLLGGKVSGDLPEVGSVEPRGQGGYGE
jgi:hypothetical protein